MRLIDADKFKQKIAATTIKNNLVVSKCNAVCDLIDSQPTAYDVDKVVERLEKRRDDFVRNITLNSQADDLYDEIKRVKDHYNSIIGIVKEEIRY